MTVGAIPTPLAGRVNAADLTRSASHPHALRRKIAKSAKKKVKLSTSIAIKIFFKQKKKIKRLTNKKTYAILYTGNKKKRWLKSWQMAPAPTTARTIPARTRQYHYIAPSEKNQEKKEKRTEKNVKKSNRNRIAQVRQKSPRARHPRKHQSVGRKQRRIDQFAQQTSSLERASPGDHI
jgi:hypothetical protein